MAAVNVCDRTSSGKNNKILVENVDITGNVHLIKEKVLRQIEPKLKDVELIYCGQKMKDDEKVEVYGVKSGSTIYALDKHVQDDTGVINPLTEQQIMVVLKSAIRKPSYTNIVQKIFLDEKKMSKIITDNPGLIDDPAVLSMLVDPGLLVSLIQPSNISKLLSRHPVFGPTALAIATMVNEEAGKEGSTAGSSTAGSYSIDQMSDDDDDMTSRAGASGGRPITTSQLAAALMQAQGQASQPGTSREGGQTTSSITEQFFQQAMMSATQSVVSDTQLQQLRDMGITDESRARQALVQTGGDLNAAVELLFDDRS